MIRKDLEEKKVQCFNELNDIHNKQKFCAKFCTSFINVEVLQAKPLCIQLLVAVGQSTVTRMITAKTVHFGQ